VLGVSASWCQSNRRRRSIAMPFTSR
jgi:hypothetical protein